MMTYEERREVQVIAEDMIEEHLNGPIRMGDLPGYGLEWTFAWHRKKRSYGTCRPMTRQILLSMYMNAGRDIEWIKDTILHEIAHALTPGAKHGPKWKAKALELGVKNPKSYRKFDGDESRRDTKRPWYLIHRETGKVFEGYFRRPTQKRMARISEIYIRRMKKQTQGKLGYITHDQYVETFGKAPEVATC